MLKKSLINTSIFTLIIINIIVWPYLFLEMGDKPGKASSDPEIEEHATETKTNSISKDNTDAPNNQEADTASEVEKKEIFKILKIE
jgi:hypothetical protein